MAQARCWRIKNYSGEFRISYKSLCSNAFLTFILLRRLARDVYSGFEAADGVLGGATKWSEVQKFCRWVKNINQNMMLLKSISHPHIAAPRRHWCNKEIRGIGNGGNAMWQMQLTLLRAVVMSMQTQANRWWVTNMIINQSNEASAQCHRGYCSCVAHPRG